METSNFILVAYGLTGVALGLLCLTTWLRARAVRRELRLRDKP